MTDTKKVHALESSDSTEFKNILKKKLDNKLEEMVWEYYNNVLSKELSAKMAINSKKSEKNINTI